MELTLDQLAARVGMTPRNVREWQTIGVLPPPARRGRAAVYGAMHVRRIERVKSLRTDGFPLEVIRQFLDRSDGTAADVLSLSATAFDPSGHAGTATMTRAHFVERLGAEAMDAMMGCGIVVPSVGDCVTVMDTAMLDQVEELMSFGLPVASIAPALTLLLEKQVDGLEALAGIYREQVWQPFVEAGLPASEWHDIALTAGAMRDALMVLGGQSLRRALDVVIARAAIEQASNLNASDG